MPARRELLVASAGVCLPALAGCLDVSRTDATIREVNVLLDNRDVEPRTFAFALALDDDDDVKGTLEWDSRTVEANDSITATIEPPTDSIPARFYGVVDDVESTLEFDDLDAPDEEFCLYLYFWYRHPFMGDVEVERAPYLDCE
ncbi:hypothetical protein ACLI4Q_16130 [Natrialbaceae archaeon A-CW1-1]